MKFTIDTPTFAEAAVFAAKAINARPVTPVLSGIRIEAAAGVLRLAGFDYEVSNRTTAAAEVTTPGHVLVSGRMLTDILSKLPKSRPVTMELDGNKVTLTSGRASYRLSAMQFDDFPEMPELPAAAGTVDGELFADAITSVAGAVATEDALPILMSVYITTDGNRMTFQSTDRYRLAQRVIDWAPADPTIGYKWLVKAKTLADVAKLAAGELQVMANDSMLGFRTGNRATTTLTVEGDFPKIGSLFPDHTPNNTIADRAQLAEIVARVSLVAERNTPVRIVSDGGELTIDAGTGEDAQGLEAMDAELEGDPITSAFNPGFLGWALKTIPTTTVRLGYSHPSKPCHITPTDDTDLRILIMPVRLPGQKP